MEVDQSGYKKLKTKSKTHTKIHQKRQIGPPWISHSLRARLHTRFNRKFYLKMFFKDFPDVPRLITWPSDMF